MTRIGVSHPVVLTFLCMVLLPLLVNRTFADTTTQDDSSQLVGHYKQVDSNTFLISLRPGAEMISSLITFQKIAKIRSASVTGVGVTRNNVLGFYTFNPDGTPAKTHTQSVVKEAREVVSLTCNLTTAVIQENGERVPAPPHCHISLAGSSEKPANGQGFPVVGGHLISAEVGVIAE